MIGLFDMSYWNNYDINEGPLLKYLNYISDILKLGNRKLEYYENTTSYLDLLIIHIQKIRTI